MYVCADVRMSSPKALPQTNLS
uniref:Uncharacterized protein n=1 Tax=Anguilla anguilla TaxID=7936 RepID=A0A0E9XG28_ANGAN